MVRKGSPVRVRQRACGETLASAGVSTFCGSWWGACADDSGQVEVKYRIEPGVLGTAGSGDAVAPRPIVLIQRAKSRQDAQTDVRDVFCDIRRHVLTVN